MKTGALVFSLLLAGCTGLAAPKPVSTRLQTGSLSVIRSDGSRCEAALMGVAPWAGRIDACDLGYTVTPDPGPNPLHWLLTGFVRAIGTPDLIAPAARIDLTDASGKSYGFRSPQR